MKLAIQIVGVILLLVGVAMPNARTNQMKRDKCIDAGGKFVPNTTHANLSICILEN